MGCATLQLVCCSRGLEEPWTLKPWLTALARGCTFKLQNLPAFLFNSGGLVVAA